MRCDSRLEARLLLGLPATGPATLRAIAGQRGIDDLKALVDVISDPELREVCLTRIHDFRAMVAGVIRAVRLQEDPMAMVIGAASASNQAWRQMLNIRNCSDTCNSRLPEVVPVAMQV